VSVRRDFAAAVEGFVTLVSAIASDAWDGPGLGEWTVRDLVGHASRALSTIETYLGAAPAPGVADLVIHDPLDYLLAVRGPLVDPAAVAQRGRETGAALGADPAAAVRALAARVTALVAASADEAPVATAAAGATLVAYLPTRTFELTVHTLDLATALDVEAPPVLAAPIAACLQLAAAVAARSPSGGLVLLALTGRRPLPPGFSVI
jgi:uncharacterized protein (TIGR03083 family)